MEKKTLFQEDFLEEEEEELLSYKLPKDSELPPVIREVVTNAPKDFKIPSFIACLAPLCCLAGRIQVKYYYDSYRPSALLLQVIIVGEQSSGKSFARFIEETIIGPTLRARDLEQRRKEQEYREMKRAAAKTKKIPEEPKTTIRQVPVTISKTQLVKRTDYLMRVLGGNLPFWMFSEELSAMVDAGKQGFSNLRTIVRTAFDKGSLFGIDFASENSYSALVDIWLCAMYCSTPSALDEYMDRKAIEGGNVSRIILCELEQKPGSTGIFFKPYTPEQQKIIDETLKRMMDDTYAPDGSLMPEKILELEWLNQLARKWCGKKAEESARSGSKAIEAFYKRSSVSAFRATALCYYLYDGDPDAEKRCRQIYLFLVDYIYKGLMKKWGGRYEYLVANRTEEMMENPIRRVPIFKILPKEFTKEMLRDGIKNQRLNTPASVFISQWKYKRWIKEIGKNLFKKLK